MSLQKRYEQLSTDRNVYLDRARAASRLTLPTLFPPSGANGTTSFPTPWQSMGARCVNNLSAKLLTSLFPPNAPFFRFIIDDFTLEKLTQQPGMRADVEKALNKVERAIQSELEGKTARPALFEALKQLIVGGNTLIVLSPQNDIRVFNLANFVVKRDPLGNPLEMITHERISPMEVPDEVRVAAQANKTARPGNEDTLNLYTGWKLETTASGARWMVWQEVEGVRVSGSEGNFPHDKCPARPVRWNSVDGEDYGRGMVEEYIGDFKSLEGLQKAIVQGSAAAAKVLFLVRPNGSTKASTIAQSESGDVHQGNAEDVTVLQMEKYNDFRVALETRNEIQQALAFAFMLNTAIQRNGERVTAEEIRYMAQELESGLGGIYSTLSQDLQLPMVTLLMNNMERAGRMPSLPKGVVRPAITTGIEAIGRGNDLSRIRGFMEDLGLLGEAGIGYVNMGDLVKRLGTARQLDMDGLVKSEEEVAQAQQQAQMMALAERAAPNMVNQAGAMMNPQGA